MNTELIYDQNKDWQVGIAPSKDGFQQVSFVNGVNTWVGGTHIDYILNQIIPFLRDKIEKKYKVTITPNQIKNHIFLFINATIKNPQFSSQTKERCVNDKSSFINPIKLTDKFLKDIYKSEITNLIVDWLDTKQQAEEKAAERELNKELSKVKILKLIDAKGKNREKCKFFIAEGDSPLTAFRKFRNPEIHGALPLRGKIKNVYGLTGIQALQNDEVKSIFSALGLQIGNHNHSNMRYGEICILTDADQDGNCIAGLILNIFNEFFPELINEGKISRILTPILSVKNKTEYKEFYYEDEYEEWSKDKDLSKYDIKYYKGLAALDNKMSEKMINDPVKFYFTQTNKDIFKTWFGEDTELRKQELS